MRVSAGRLIARGLRNRCPNCGAKTLFSGFFSMNDRCARCGLPFDREEGFYLGALVINYTATALPLVPLFVLVFLQAASIPLILAVSLIWCIVFPILFYRSSKSLWLMLYFLIFPRELPANSADAGR